MNESAFETLADSLLEALEDTLLGSKWGDDTELQSGVLTLASDQGTWLLNKHAPLKQVWLSSPKSGARHYAFDEKAGKWADTRGGDDLLSVLSQELGVALDWSPE